MQQHQNQLLKVEQVAGILCMSKSHVWAQAKDVPEFPKPFKLSAKQTRWKLSAVDAYIEARAATQH
jgi:predicted DNA-binding transcriptional regulator AlpA